MKIFPAIVTGFLLASSALSQTPDPLAVTLPNGKTVHFQTAEQKAKFEAAQARMHGSAATAPPASPVASSAPASKPALGSSLDATPTATKTMIQGRIAAINQQTGEISIDAEKSGKVGMDVADGEVGLKGVPVISKLAEGDHVDVIGVPDGFHDFNEMGRKVHAFRYLSGQFTNASGKIIK